MFIALLLTLLVIISGAFVSYWYEDDAPFQARLCMGACTGLAAWGLLGFMLASLLGLTPVSVLLTTALVCAPLLGLRNAARRSVFTADARGMWAALWQAVNRPTRRTTVYGLFYAAAGVLLWRVFDRALTWDANGGIGTGVQNNLGDLPFHLSVITGFAYGDNFPPADPTYAGIKFTYPFITDFISAMYLAVGADFKSCLLAENLALALSLVGLLHFWTLRLTKDRIAGLIAPLLVIFSGGLGWLNLLKQAKDSDTGLFGLLAVLQQKYTIGTDPYRWGNAMTTLLVPQRGLLLGVPLAVVVFALVWKLTDTDGESERRSDAETDNAAAEVEETEGKAKKQKKKPLSASPSLARLPVELTDLALGAGMVAALLPLVHAHTYVAVLAVCGLIAVASLLPLLRRENGKDLLLRRVKVWAVFFGVAVVVALPQMVWATMGSAVQTSKFYAFKVGWDKPENMGLVWFWLQNTGFFIPLLLAALVWRKGEGFLLPRRLLYFFAPFTLCFIAPNLFQMSPWIWDNIKVIFYWWVGSAPIVALFLAHLWRYREKAVKVLAAVLLLMVIGAGAADVWAIANGKTENGIFDADNVAFAEVMRQKTPPRAVILNAPSFSAPVFLSGRQPVMGYPGHVWSHGIEPGPREQEITEIYTGGARLPELLAKYNVQFLVIGPQERALPGFNEAAFANYAEIAKVGAYRLLQIK